MNPSVFDAIARRVAVGAVGPSTVRGQAPGTMLAARNALATLPLREFASATARTFDEVLDRHTDAIRRSLPAKSRHWGVARKVLNIYLRDALYHHYLRSRHDLGKVESLLELPLDLKTASQLDRLDDALRWRGVKHVTADESRRYQAVAKAEAERRDTFRIHLDALFWTPDEQGRTSTRRTDR